ncbi:MAG: DUF481 domain-containing protein [Bacteroidota bacterium]
MKRLFVIVLFILTFGNVYPQFNDSTHYLLRYATTGILNRTNETSAYTITNGLRFSVNKKAISLNSTSNWIYGEQQKRLTNNDFSTALDLNVFSKLDRMYYWGLGTYETSYSLKVNNRAQAGLGIAYSIVDRPDLFINVSDGILYEFADLKLSDTTRDIYRTFRNSFRFRVRYAFKERVSFESTSFLQNALQKNDDYIFNSTNTLSIKIAKWISLTSMLKFNKVNRTNRENLLLTFGLTAEKYF